MDYDMYGTVGRPSQNLTVEPQPRVADDVDVLDRKRSVAEVARTVMRGCAGGGPVGAQSRSLE